MTEIEQRINELVSSFVNDITKLARDAALDTLSAALAGVGGTVISDLRLGAPRRGRPPKALVLARAAAAAAAAGGGRRGKGSKRPSAEIDKLKDKVMDYIRQRPGERIEQINTQLQTTTSDLSLPLKKLIADGAVRTEGDRRATRYYPGDGTPRGRKRGRKRKE